MKVQTKRLQIVSILLLLCFNSSLFNLAIVNAAEKKPTLWITIYSIYSIDDIEGWLGGGPEWYYQISIQDYYEFKTYALYTLSTTVGDGIVDNTHEFILDELSSSKIVIYIALLESDSGTDEVADISSHSGTVEAGQRVPAPRGAVYQGYYNLKTNSLSGDTTYPEEGYYKTSGNYDGSTATDENDAYLLFDIGDNYNTPTAEAGPNKNSYTGVKVNFDGSSSSASSGSSIVLYEWDFENDGIIDATGAKTSYTFAENGTYTVKLKITDSLGETDSDTCKIYVLPQGPTASFTYSPSEPTMEDVVYFYDTSDDPDGSIVSWSWNFGDGSTSTLKDPTHTYTDKGYYEVQLNVTDNDSESDSQNSIITIINISPSANFSYSPASPKVGTEIQFTDKSKDPEGKSLEYLWDFGDGFSSTTRNPKHKYTISGLKFVTLSVTDDEGVEVSMVRTFQIWPNLILSANFSYSPENQKMKHGVQFTDESTDIDGHLVEWLWNFGDGKTSTQENPTHAFIKGGEYTVKLTVTDDCGDDDDRTKKVSIIQTYDLIVQVKDILGLNIENAEIEVYDSSKRYASGSTDSTGKVSLTEIPEGNYAIRTKVFGVSTLTTCSLTRSKTEETRVTVSQNTVGAGGGVVVLLALAIFFIKRKKEPGPPVIESRDEEAVFQAAEEDVSLEEKKKELERERIMDILQTFKDSFDKGEMDEETYLRLKKKYEDELKRLG